MFRSMGTRAAVKRTESGSEWKAAASPMRSVSLGIDIPLMLVVVTLLIFGLLMVYSASYDISRSFYGNPLEVFLRQVAWLGLGVAGAVIMTFFNYHRFQKVAVPMMLVSVGLLILVWAFGENRYNAVRTLFGGSIQPSELAKIVVIIYLAVWLYSKRENLASLTLGMVPLGLILGVNAGLIYIQPDLSAVLTIVLLGGIMFFLAGSDMRHLKQILLMAAATLAVFYFIVQINPTGSSRVEDYLTGLKDPTQGSYHVRRSLEAFFNGGWTGVGIGNSTTKSTGLPFPHTDSIFAVIGEEAGLLGAVGVVALYTLLLWRGLVISYRAPDQLGSLLAAGLSIWLAIEAFVNMAVMIGLLPFAGNALPFISAGGSNMIVSLAAVGILLNISRLSSQEQDEARRSLFEVVDLRGRDRRRRVSRADRLERAQSD
jgi:cell division protein FtsW